MQNGLKGLIIAVCIPVMSCVTHNNVTLDETFVKGGEITIGNGLLFDQYVFQVEDLYVSRYEFTWGTLAPIIDYGIEQGHLEIKKNKLYPLSGSFPEFSSMILDFSKTGGGLAVNGENVSVAAGSENFPVCNIAWFGIPYLCNIMSEMNHYKPCYETKTWTLIEGSDGYRLPTFEEWEYIARGGAESKGYVYAGSNDAEEVGWFRSNSDGTVHRVGQKKPNELGVYDMSGNMNEFTTEISKPVMFSPGLTLLTANRIWRGGSFVSGAVDTFEFKQNANFPDYFLPFADVGFRTVRNKPRTLFRLGR